jgi:hypothetical protein
MKNSHLRHFLVALLFSAVFSIVLDHLGVPLFLVGWWASMVYDWGYKLSERDFNTK